MKKYNNPEIEILLISDQIIMNSDNTGLSKKDSGNGMSEDWLDVFPS